MVWFRFDSTNDQVFQAKTGQLAASGNISGIPHSVVFFYFEGNSRKDPTILSSMAHRLENYLRTNRKQSGLTQQEVAFLLGCETSAQVSRYEKRRRLPPLETALACEAVFGIPVAELFAGVRQGVGRDIEKRRLELKARLQTRTPNASSARIIEHKLRWLADREHPVIVNQTSAIA
jgi:transcriptional regulator with XRE-family HTH domain